MARNAYIASYPAARIVTRDEAKQHLRVIQNDDDIYIDNLIGAAQQNIENYCNIILFRTIIVQRGDCWADISELYFSPIKNSGNAAIVKIQYYDSDNTLQTWAAANYIFDKYSQPCRIGINPNITLPTLAIRIDAVEVTYSIGTADISVIPTALKQAALILVGQWYENRQEAVVGRSVGTIPMTAQYLINPYRIQTLGINIC